MRAPRLPADPAFWLNTGGRALTLERGVVYLLDFWTYCCINCQHVLPDLRWLEEKCAGRPFGVIGVHSGKFDAEKHADAVRQAVLRLDVRHPVVRDDDYQVWRAFGVRAWPTLVLVDAKGYIADQVSGEGHRDRLDQRIESLLRAAAAGPLLAAPPSFFLERDARPDTALSFPGKVLADPAGARLFIADTGHHRFVVAPLAGGRDPGDYTMIGSGAAGFADGPFASASFRGPQGMALSRDGRTLLVADTENHAVRRVDLFEQTVTTIAGTGRQALGPVGTGVALETDLNSPWDLALSGDEQTLYVALAGSHQIGVVDLAQNTFAVCAGTGREVRVDGPGEQAAFAQPSGLVLDSMTNRLFVADSETSCVRQIVLSGSRNVTTLAGSGDLFDFGRVDGTGEDARFQHPLGVAWHAGSGTLFVADTYNQIVRRVEVSGPAAGRVIRLAGSGSARDLFEPGGLSVAAHTLYVADTNNHRVRTVDISSGALGDFCVDGLPRTTP